MLNNRALNSRGLNVPPDIAGDFSVSMGGLGVISLAGGISSVGMGMGISSVAGKQSVIALPKLSINSWSSGISNPAIGYLSVSSKAGGASSVKLNPLKVTSLAGGNSTIALPKLSVTSTAYPPFSSSVSMGVMSVNSVAGGVGTASMGGLSVTSYSGGVSVIALPRLYIVSGVELARLAYVMNVKTSETTTYTNYDFIEIIRLGQDSYGVTPTGLFKLSGTTDNGTAIAASFTTHENSYGTNLLKRLPQVYIDSEDTTTLQPIIDGVAKNSHDAGFGGHRTKLGRGYIGKWWQWKLSNKSGAPMRVGAIEALIEPMSRRI